MKDTSILVGHRFFMNQSRKMGKMREVSPFKEEFVEFDEKKLGFKRLSGI